MGAGGHHHPGGRRATCAEAPRSERTFRNPCAPGEQRRVDQQEATCADQRLPESERAVSPRKLSPRSLADRRHLHSRAGPERVCSAVPSVQLDPGRLGRRIPGSRSHGAPRVPGRHGQDELTAETRARASLEAGWPGAGWPGLLERLRHDKNRSRQAVEGGARKPAVTKCGAE